jgi:hypothetical protein
VDTVEPHVDPVVDTVEPHVDPVVDTVEPHADPVVDTGVSEETVDATDSEYVANESKGALHAVLKTAFTTYYTGFLKGDAGALNKFKERFSTNQPNVLGSYDATVFDPTESTSGDIDLLTKMETTFNVVIDAIMALRTHTGNGTDASSILIDRFLDDYANNLEFYRWLDSDVRVISDYGFGVDASVSDDHYIPDTLQRLTKSYRPGSSEFNMIVPLLLCPTNRKESYYGGFQITSDIDDIMKAITDVLYHHGRNMENPGNTGIFATFLQEIRCPEHSIRLIDPEVRKILVTHCGTTKGLGELSRKLRGRHDRPKGVVEDESSYPNTTPSCGSTASGIMDTAKHGNPLAISSEILAYLTMCEKNKSSAS